MSCGTLANLLAEGNGWGQLIGPLLLFGFYVVASIVKAVSNRRGDAGKDDDDETETARAVDQPRDKPIEQVSRPPQSPPSRTLPYARTVEQAQQRSGDSVPRHEPADQQRDEWERQQDIKRRRAEQIEQLRRRQQLEQQQQQRLEQQRRQSRQQTQQQPQQRRPAPPAARKATGAVAVRQKSGKEAVRQARAGVPVHVGASRRDVLKQSAAKAAKSALLPSVGGSRPAAASLRGLLNQKQSVRTAIVLSEILDKPLGMR